MSKEKLSMTEIVDQMAINSDFTKKVNEEFIKKLLSTIENALLEGESVKVKGFGTFKPQWNEARKSVDVQTGKEIIIPGYYRVVFAPESEIQVQINEQYSHLEAIVLSDESSEQQTKQDIEDETILVQEEQELDTNLNFFASQVEEIKNILSDITAMSSASHPVLEAKKELMEEEIPDEENKITDEISIESETAAIYESEVNEAKEDIETIEESIATDKSESIEDIKTSYPVHSDIVDNDMKNEEISNENIEEKEEDVFDIVRDISILYGNSSTSTGESEIPEETEVANDIKSSEVPEYVENTEESDVDFINQAAILDNPEQQDIISDEDLEEAEDDDDEMEDEEDDVFVDEEDVFLEEVNYLDDKEDDIICVDDTNDEIQIEEKVQTNNVSSDESQPTDVGEEAGKEEESVIIDDHSSAPTSQKVINHPPPPPPVNTTIANDDVESDSPRKVPYILISVIVLVVLWGVLVWKYFPAIYESNLARKKNQRIEFLVDSVANSNRIKQIQDSLGRFLKIDSVNNSLSGDTTIKSPTMNSEITNSEQSIYSTPREYTEFITTEKMLVGSNLNKFAKIYYGHPYFWVYIYEANRDIIRDPNNVPINIDIKIPKVDPRLTDVSNKENLNYALELQRKYLK